jgi:hypothetical protein
MLKYTYPYKVYSMSCSVTHEELSKQLYLQKSIYSYKLPECKSYIDNTFNWDEELDRILIEYQDVWHELAAM